MNPARERFPLRWLLALQALAGLALGLEAAQAQQNTTTQYGYDNQGNLTTITDPLGRVTDHTFDALNRLKTIVRPPAVSGGPRPSIEYTYDGADQLTKVKDPKTLDTSYNPNGLGNLQSQSSPDTGGTNFEYDAAGNLKKRTDARGKESTYNYDALNRLTQISFNDTTPTINFVYDQFPDGAGRLSYVAMGNNANIWAYDKQGRVIAKTQLHGSQPYYVLYPRDAQNGRPLGIVYPSGKAVGFYYDSAGRLQSLVAQAGTAQQLLYYVSLFHPSGAPAVAVYGNNQAHVQGYDLDGRLAAYSTYSPTNDDYRILIHNAASLIESSYKYSAPGVVETYEYDGLDRLKSWSDAGSGQGQSFTYDLTGNRLTQGIPPNNYTYDYPGSSHRLSSVSGPQPKSNVYDAIGSLTSDGTSTFTYDARGRMVQATNSVISASYVVDGLGQRIAKTLTAGGQSVTIHYVYDEQGRLLGEYDASTGQAIQEYVWLGNALLAIMRGTVSAPEYYWVEMDHLGTPRQVRDINRGLRWEWKSDPFGVAAPNQNPSGLGTFWLYLRFPGQYYDVETNLHYNYFRDYDPAIGRYIQSDPIGLQGGINTYAYVGNNPLTNIDPDGTLFFAALGLPPALAALGDAVVVTSGILAALAVGEKLVQPVNDPAPSVPAPNKRPGMYVCNCRAQCRADCLKPGDQQQYGIGTASGTNFPQVKKAARKAAEALISCQGKHTTCKCVDPKGQPIRE